MVYLDPAELAVIRGKVPSKSSSEEVGGPRRVNREAHFQLIDIGNR